MNEFFFLQFWLEGDTLEQMYLQKRRNFNDCGAWWLWKEVEPLTQRTSRSPWRFPAFAKATQIKPSATPRCSLNSWHLKTRWHAERRSSRGQGCQVLLCEDEARCVFLPSSYCVEASVLTGRHASATQLRQRCVIRQVLNPPPASKTLRLEWSTRLNWDTHPSNSLRLSLHHQFNTCSNSKTCLGTLWISLEGLFLAERGERVWGN